jgi:hypothetical protein
MEFIQGFFRELAFIGANTLDYLSNTHFYQYLSKLFYREGEARLYKEESTNIQDSVKSEKTQDKISKAISDKRYYSEKEDSLRKTYKSKLADFINQKSEEENIVREDAQTPIENNTNYKKYLIIGGIIIGAGLL